MPANKNDKTWSMKPDRAKALMLARRQLSALVCDAVNLEGINFTLPEIQTLLDGITVGGHKLSDQQIALNQADAWKHLFASIENEQFSLNADFAFELHAIAGKEYQPPDAAKLPDKYSNMLTRVEQIDDIYEAAIFVFLSMARNQFFYDVNKRMGRFMMNGLLLSQGYPAINLPARRQLEFNTLMLEFYTSADYAPMTAFMRSCLDQRLVKIMQE